MQDKSRGAAVFLFAHQDDEFGVLATLAQKQTSEQKSVCIYLTRGDHGDQDVARRNAESLKVLAWFGISAHNVLFLGESLSVGDGQLHLRWRRALDGLNDALQGMDVSEIYVPAWEGGHTDHDAVHVIGIRWAELRHVTCRTKQFSLYHGLGLPASLFRVLSPIDKNGPAEICELDLRTLAQSLRACFAYPSQWRSWIGLAPFVVIKLLVQRAYHLQAVSIQRIAERPHAGKLLYERRGAISYEQFQTAIDQAAIGEFGGGEVLSL